MDEAYSTAYIPQRDPEPASARRFDYDTRQPKGAAWVMYAGIVIAIVGVMNTIFGLAAISESNSFERAAEYIAGDLKTWGWVVLIVGAVQIAAAFAIWREARWGRWVGIPTAAVNAIVQVMWMPAYPLLALALFSATLLVLYGLIVYPHPSATGARR